MTTDFFTNKWSAFSGGRGDVVGVFALWGTGASAGQTPRGESSVAEVELRGLRESVVGSELEAVDKPKVGTVLGGEGHATKPPLVPATHDAFHPLNGQWTVEKPLVAPLSIGERVHHTDTA